MKNERALFQMSELQIGGRFVDGTRPRFEVPAGRNKRANIILPSALPQEDVLYGVLPRVRLSTHEHRNTIGKDFQTTSFQLQFEPTHDIDSEFEAERLFKLKGMSEEEFQNMLKTSNLGAQCLYSSQAGLEFGPSSGEMFFQMTRIGGCGIPQELVHPGRNLRTDGTPFPSARPGLTFRLETGSDTWNFEYSTHIMNHPNDPKTSLFFAGGVLIDTEKFPRLADNTWEQIHGTDWDDTFAEDVIHPYTVMRTYTFNS